MTRPKHPLAVLVLAILWPVITLTFVMGLRTEGRMFDVPNWIHDGLKPLGVIAYLIGTWWVLRQVVALRLSRKLDA